MDPIPNYTTTYRSQLQLFGPRSSYTKSHRLQWQVGQEWRVAWVLNPPYPNRAETKNYEETTELFLLADHVALGGLLACPDHRHLARHSERSVRGGGAEGRSDGGPVGHECVARDDEQ